MRNERRKRLGALGAVLLLTTLLGAAFASVASAQVVTGQFLVKVTVQNGSGGTQEKTDFAFTLDGGAPQNYPLSGIVSFNVDASVPHTFLAVDFPNFTPSYDSHCANVTVTPGTPIICNILETFNEPITTTTTTTTLPPISTTTAGEGTHPVSGSYKDTNKCTSHLNPELQPDGHPAITVTMSATAAPEPHHGNAITLSKTKAVITIPAGLIQTGVDVNLIHNGDKVPSVATVVIAGQNTVEGTHAFTIGQTATIVVINGKAQPITASLPLPDTSWTPVNDTSNVFFAQKSLKIVSTINLVSAGLKVTATFTCVPSTAAQFVGVGAEGTLTQPTTPGTGGGGGGGTPGDTTGTGGLATPGATELPRTGSNPWPLLVLGAGLLAVGLAAIDAAKRRRRPIHH